MALQLSSRTLLTEINMPNPDGAFSLGICCTIKLQIPRKTPSYKVSADAIIFNEAGFAGRGGGEWRGAPAQARGGTSASRSKSTAASSAAIRRLLILRLIRSPAAKVRTRLQPMQTS